MQTGSLDSFPPSFNSSSNSRLAGIAARVVEECGSEEYYDEFYFEREEHKSGSTERETGDGSVNPVEDDGEFEFAFVKRDSELPSPVSADDIFCNGQILPVYPVFNRDLFLDRRNGFEEKGKNDVVQAVRLPLRKLFIEERETTPSSSSSEADELEGVPEETYCVWRPPPEGRCKKVNSAGSNSKRWRFRDLLHRSFSDGGKDRFVFSSPSFNGRRKENEEKMKPPPPPAVTVAPPPYKRDGRGKAAVVHAV
ncbi:hypothetical protein CASFOL_027864 [Castilleja foliolosa]|uniref:Uncharacterized protein n=1 Tax=Castilleja foliolosa TaxID=1961234 RepID=A0ABD3CGV7_9LAMI